MESLVRMLKSHCNAVARSKFLLPSLPSLSRFVPFRSGPSLLRYNATSTSPPPSSPVVSLNKELPDPFVRQKRNRIYFVCYGIGVVVSCLVIFNFEKTNSPIITSAFFFMRRLSLVADALGNDIEYALSYPWISGPLNTVKGNIDISFEVKGSKGTGTVRLKATRTLKITPFDVRHFVLETHGKHPQVIDLAADPAIEF